MEVGILYCPDCLFSQKAHAQLSKALETMLGIDRQKLNLAIHTFDIKEIESHSKATQLHRAKVQIVVVSHHFLERLKHDATVKKKPSPVNRILRPKRVIAILLSVLPEEILDGFQKYLVQFSDWHSIELKSSTKLDPDFYKKFSEQILKIYNFELSSTLSFSLFPKKITKDQSKVAILFKASLEVKDKVQLDLTRGRQRERINEVMMSNSQAGLFRIPSSMLEDGTSLIEITVYINGKTIGTKQVKFEHNFKIPDEDAIERMNSLVPGFRKVLDDHVSQQLSKNFRSCTDFNMDPSLELVKEALNSKSDDFPTVIHFAANYGLAQTVGVLLYEGDGVKLAMVKNDVGETAVDIAMEKGFPSIGQTIKDFYEMTNTFGALQYIKDLCDRHSNVLDLLSGEEAENTSNSDSVDTKLAQHTYQNQPILNTSTTENLEYMTQSEDDDRATVVPDGIVTILVDTPPDDGNQSEEVNDSERISETENLQVPLPVLVNPQTVQAPNTCANVIEGQSSSGDTKAQILLSYDVPPPPVQIQKPPRKPGTIQDQAYDVPRQSHYCVIPLNGPVVPAKPTHAPKIPQPTMPVLSIKQTLAPIQTPDGYMPMHPSLGGATSDTTILANGKRLDKPKRIKNSLLEELSLKYPMVHPAKGSLGGLSKKGFLNIEKTNPNPLTKQFSLDSTQEELLELMNDFKNNVYNLRELELLYENWKQRNDVQRDFKARQKELKEIQKEYNRIQEKVRRETRKPGPISKLLKLIPGARKKTSVVGVDLGAKDDTVTAGPSTPPVMEEPERKVSETSTSDRSTLSEVSVPDSGVSDPDSDKDRLRGQTDTGTYVPPSIPTPVSNQATEDVSSAVPSRPPKKPSVTAEHAPPAFHVAVKKPSLPLPPSESSDLNGQLADTISPKTLEVEMTNGGVLAPSPPPRILRMDSPFSYINYDGKAKGLPKTSQ